MVVLKLRFEVVCLTPTAALFSLVDFIYTCTGWAQVTVYVWRSEDIWRSEDNFRGLVLSFYNVGPRVQTQFDSLGSRHLYLPGHLVGWARDTLS